MPTNPHEYRDIYQPHKLAPRKTKRLALFLSVFLAFLLATQTFIFTQAPVFSSEASILTTATTDVDQTSEEADIQHINIQKNLLLGQSVLEITAHELLNNSPENPLTVEDLRNMFSVNPVIGTNLLKLTATGNKPQLLQNALDTWIQAYLQVRKTQVAALSEKGVNSLNDELTRIEAQVNNKREEINQFRIEHNILSVESADNQAHSRLLGLNESLNKALSDEVNAKANLDALHSDIAQGKTVIPETDSLAFSVLVEQAGKLRQKLSDLRGQYTEEYIKFNPALREIPEQLARLDAEIVAKSKLGKDIIIHEAESNYAASHQTVVDLQKQLVDLKTTTADYTSQFAKLQSLQSELQALETLQQSTKQRLVDIEVKQRQKYPQVEVIDAASLPGKPVGPDYWREAAIGFAASLSLGLLLVWIYDYLRSEDKHAFPQAEAINPLYAQPLPAIKEFSTPTAITVENTKLLENIGIPRELSKPEILAMFNAAETSTRCILALLLNGLSVAEILSLNADSFDFIANTIHIPTHSRSLTMISSTLSLLTAHPWQPIELVEQEVDALISCAAIDGGLSTADQIRSATISFTYALFLIRQGIKLSELPKIIGPISPSSLLLLGKYSPDLAGLPLDKIDLDYLKYLA